MEGLLPGGRMLGMVTIIDNRPLRHPEKAGKPDAPLLLKPDWIRVRMPTASAEFAATRRIVKVRQEREPIAALAKRVEAMTGSGGRFLGALGRTDRVNVIAECKRRSPSRGRARTASGCS